MKTQPNEAIREVRTILDLTQSEFGAMLGVTRDAVVSWELGRNRLSRKHARRIALATGVDEKVLINGRGPVTTQPAPSGQVPFTQETFKAHRKSHWGGTDEAAARRHHRNCADALEMLFLAAVQPDAGKTASRLPAVVDSFVAWCRETAEAFQLGPQIEQQLAERKYRQPLTHSYKEWRRMAQEDPTVCRAWGFKDDPDKSDEETLTLEAEMIPLWRPGYSMRPPARPAGL